MLCKGTWRMFAIVRRTKHCALPSFQQFVATAHDSSQFLARSAGSVSCLYSEHTSSRLVISCCETLPSYEVSLRDESSWARHVSQHACWVSLPEPSASASPSSFRL